MTGRGGGWSIGPRRPGSATGWRTSGTISAAAVERTTAAIASMVEEAWQHHAQAIVAVGTAGLRAAGNRDEVVAAIEAATGITVDHHLG